MVKIYKQPFAHGGDTIAIPDASQPDGKMSGADGWTPDYQLPKTDPNYKPVGRQEMNGVFKEVTEALGQVQVQGAASWSADGAPYPINAQVYHNDKQWIALRANSVQPVEGADWSAIGTAATYDVGESAGQVMQVGAFGIGSGVGVNLPNGNANTLIQSGFYAGTSEWVGSPYTGADGRNQGTLIHIAWGGAGDYATQFYKQVQDHIFKFRFKDDGNWSDWVDVIHSDNLLQTTGSSTDFPMSQAAATNAINAGTIGVGQTWQDVSASRAPSVTYTNTTGRPIEVSISVTSTSTTDSAAFTLLVGGVTIARPLMTYGGSLPGVASLSAIVPNGVNYGISSMVGSIYNWTELR